MRRVAKYTGIASILVGVAYGLLQAFVWRINKDMEREFAPDH